MRTMSLEKSRGGRPTVSECGGGATSTGSCTIVCGPNGEMLYPMFTPTRGYSNAVHAVFEAREGMVLVEVSRDRRGASVSLYSLNSITRKGEGFEAFVNEFGWVADGESDYPPVFEDAVKAAIEKSKCYHCREAHYILR